MAVLCKTIKIESSQFASYLITHGNFQASPEVSFSDLVHTLTTRPKESISLENQSEINNVKGFRNLKENWDSYGAIPVDEVSIEKTIEFIKAVDLFDVDVYLTSPGPNGEVMAQLKNRQKEIEFIFYPEKEKFVKFCENDFIEQGNYKDLDLSEFINWLDVVE